MRSLMVQGTSSGAGKSTLVAALCRIFSQKGYRVAPFKSQNMSNFAYVAPDFEISRAQAVQAVAAGCPIEPDLNPIMLKPLGDYYSAVYIQGKYYGKMHARSYYSAFARSMGLRAAAASLYRLRKRYDLVILEGAGSPAEINLQRYDIANMRMATKSDAAVLLVSDIDKGGSFASLAGTMSLIQPRYRGRVKGFILNKFRGDARVLEPAFKKIRRLTGIPVMGTIPMIPLDLPEEDSLNVKAREMAWSKRNVAKIDGEIDRLAEIVRENVDMWSIERMVR